MLRSLEQILISGLVIAGILYLLYGAWLYLNQQRMIYYPDFALPRDDLPTERFVIDGETIDGYHNTVTRHLDVGLEILAGRADVGPGIRAVAGMLGLGVH